MKRCGKQRPCASCVTARGRGACCYLQRIRGRGAHAPQRERHGACGLREVVEKAEKHVGSEHSNTAACHVHGRGALRSTPASGCRPGVASRVRTCVRLRHEVLGHGPLIRNIFIAMLAAWHLQSACRDRTDRTGGMFASESTASCRAARCKHLKDGRVKAARSAALVLSLAHATPRPHCHASVLS